MLIAAHLVTTFSQLTLSFNKIYADAMRIDVANKIDYHDVLGWLFADQKALNDIQFNIVHCCHFFLSGEIFCVGAAVGGMTLQYYIPS